ncbi:MAG: hypothetical protein FJ276_04050 [Planctomycetes bacterium]|nr:hypothetical protein [Planctomycetota bacterium]
MTNIPGVRRACLPLLLALATVACGDYGATEIPLPEHPRPDFHRPDWLNLNGAWRFRFDRDDQGLSSRWFAPAQRPLDADFPSTITVPFPWRSKLSGVPDEADIGWYARTIQVPDAWKGKRIFLVVGATDWHTTAWLDGENVGEHQGGYTPFSFELTRLVRFGNEQRVVVRVDDRPRPFKLEGKQGYGRAAGIWQTVYLEARPSVAIYGERFGGYPLDPSVVFVLKGGDAAEARQPDAEAQ